MNNNIELKGLKGWNCFSTYLSVLYYLPNTKTIRDKKFDTREQCVEFFKTQEPEVRKMILIELISLGCVDGANIEALLSVHTNKHGMSLDRSTIGNYDVVAISEMCLASLMACSEVTGGFF
ncbi:hypothetical protein [Vibrio parahaemolyticus]|uniref:hypothetical protein n=1 Tax=Vibrio parahaemolyticus TaxID=670 RepID=UPI00226A29E6|nr:hypothetical protein [Vibrio parahaemolyticus]EHK0752612.1 hypothetical protein [Vibrio parahaemolyticus]MCX8932103.1 hypothetical protein [Vibrio parahaemolyticus]MCZ6295050.1 hypothetical protein [Vibrio parahaemolyticus]